MRTISRLVGLFCGVVLAVAARSARADEPAKDAFDEDPANAQSPAPSPPAQPSAPTVVRPPPSIYVAPPPVEIPPETVLGARVTHGGYGAPALKVTYLGGGTAMLVGGEGGWVIGNAIVLGGAGYGTVVDVRSPAPMQSPAGDAHLGLSYGGARIGGILGARRVTHLTFGILVGGGRSTSETNDGTFRRTDTFFVIEPDLAAEINLARHVRLGAGGSFRFVGGTELSGFTASRLNGPAGMLTLRFGEF